jgi:TonB family protein
VTSEEGYPLPGVNVIVKGTNIGTITDASGNYEIAVNDNKQNLVFSFIGMQPVEGNPTNNQLDVKMPADNTALSEVVVTGFGSADDKSDYSGTTLEFAEPAGGKKSFQKYLEEEMEYPVQAIQNKVEGKVTVQFSVDPSGELGEFKILKSLGYGCDEEVIRLIKEGPKWNPSKRNLQPVKDKVKVRLKFKIPGK